MFVLFFPGQGLDYKGVLKPDGREIMAMARTSLKDAMCNLKDGSIQCQLLMLIRDNSDRFLELSQEINEEGNEKVVLRQCLDQRLAELRAFEVERVQVVGLIGMCNLIKGGNLFITGLHICFSTKFVTFWSRLLEKCFFFFFRERLCRFANLGLTKSW